MTATAVAAVDAAHAGMASAVHNALRQLGQVLGVAVLGALVYAPMAGQHSSPISPAPRAAFVTGLHHALWTCGLALLAAAVLAAVLFRSHGRRVQAVAETGGQAHQHRHPAAPAGDDPRNSAAGNLTVTDWPVG
jgi:hypothetical protein